MSEHTHAHARLDGLGIVTFPDGTRAHDIELRLSDDPDRDPPSLTDPVCYLNAWQARTLAAQLLKLATVAERQPHPRRRG